jgi:ABC-type Na+ transport system ATPase subunit NatA
MDVAVTLFFKDCVRASLEDKMVIFVTHQVEFLSTVYQIFVALLSAQYLFNLPKKRIKLHDTI